MLGVTQKRKISTLFSKRTHVQLYKAGCIQFSCSVVSNSLRTHKPINSGSTPGFPVHHQPQNLLKLTSIKSVMSSNHLILCCPLLLLPSVFPSIRVFSKTTLESSPKPQFKNINSSTLGFLYGLTLTSMHDY